jgi:hypothetical protein
MTLQRSSSKRAPAQTSSQACPANSPVHDVQELSQALGCLAASVTLGGGSQSAPSFPAEIDNIGRPFAQRRSGCGFLLPPISTSPLFQILHEAHHSFFKFYHSIFLTASRPVFINRTGQFSNAGNQTNKFRNKFGVLRNETV